MSEVKCGSVNLTKRVSAFLLGAAVALCLTAANVTAAEPQATVDLGLARHFAVLAYSSVTNTGNSIINGDLGVSPGTAVTGFFPVDGGPGVVHGAIYTPLIICSQNKACLTQTNDVAALGQSSLLVAYNDAAGRDVAPVDVTGVNLGGQTLTPGLYKSTSGLLIAGDLTLAGNGVYIFQMASTLTVTTGSRVVLSGGAQAANVFWQVGSSATLETTSVFEGTILAHDAISIKTGATVNGRALALNAGVTLNSSVVTNSSAVLPALVAAVLPSSRAVQVGATATAFATIINAGTTTATSCGIALLSSIPATFSYQTTNPATNQVTGTPNTPVNIGAGLFQTYVFALTPTAPIAPTDVQFTFGCTNTDPAASISGVNTLLFLGSAGPTSDIVALAGTVNNDGIVNIPGTAGTGFFVVATVNVGASDTITASVDTGGTTLPVVLSICQTNPGTGVCLAPPSSTVTLTINANETPTFAIFAQGTGNVAFDPATNRIFVRFKDAGAVTHGATSVAVRTQ